MKISKWFILAGGSASRWQNYRGVKNKCLVRIDGETLLDRTVSLLERNGVKPSDIVICGNTDLYEPLYLDDELHPAADATLILLDVATKREAFQKVAESAKSPFGILLGDCYYTEAIIKDAVNRDVTEWRHYYNCLSNPWTGCSWEEGYIHLVPNWKWWLEKMTKFNQKCDTGEITFVKDFQIDRYLRGYSPHEYKAATLDEHDIFWRDETDDFDYPKDYDVFMLHHKENKAGWREDKLSVIIPHYNTPQHLRTLLYNLAKQRASYPETEIIVVDDGSPCDMKWLVNFPVTRIYQPNRGVAAARNVGLMAATGKYIAFVDADDDIESNYLHTIYTVMRNNDCDYILFPFIAVANGNCVVQNRDELIANKAVWAWAFTWDCIAGEKFNENLNVAEDEDWLRRVVTEDKRRYQSSMPIYRYNWGANPNSLSKRYNSGELPKERAA